MRDACAAARRRIEWEIALREKGYEVTAKLERGAPLPQWYLDEPVASSGTRLILDAFWELTTERAVGMALGQIPQSRIDAYGARLGLSRGMMGLFSAAIRTCDDAYLGWAAKRRERAQGKSTSG